MPPVETTRLRDLLQFTWRRTCTLCLLCHLLDSGFSNKMAEIPESARLFMSGLIERARKLKKIIAFPEGADPRVIDAAARLARDGVVRPVLIGPKPAGAPNGVDFIDPAANTRFVEKYA